MTYPWTEDVKRLTNNIGQAISFQSSIEKKLLKDKVMAETYNAELQKFIDRGAITRLTQDKMNSYQGPISYVSHFAVMKLDSTTTPLCIVTNTSLKNQGCGIYPN